jgi:RecA/RadA recombinase
MKKTDTKSTEVQNDKQKALATTIAQIEKSYGKGAIMKLGENSAMSVSAVSTGSLSLDLALGIGGVPRGRIIEIYGPESSGKTTVALHIVAEVQKMGGEAAFIDAEHALDPVYAKALGVDIDSLLVSQPDYGEQALEITEAMAEKGSDYICAHLKMQNFKEEVVNVVLSGSMNVKMPNEIYLASLKEKCEAKSGRKLNFIKLEAAPVTGCINWLLEK